MLSTLIVEIANIECYRTVNLIITFENSENLFYRNSSHTETCDLCSGLNN